MRKEGPASMLSLLTAQDYAMAICSGSYPYLCLLFQLTHILYYSSLFYHLTVPTLVHTQVSVVISPIYVHQFRISLTIMIYNLICQFVTILPLLIMILILYVDPSKFPIFHRTWAGCR